MRLEERTLVLLGAAVVAIGGQTNLGGTARFGNGPLGVWEPTGSLFFGPGPLTIWRSRVGCLVLSAPRWFRCCLTCGQFWPRVY